jgi:hypothetical protein
MSDSEYAYDEELTPVQQIKILSKSEAMKLFDKINKGLQKIKESNATITEDILMMIKNVDELKNLATYTTESVFQYEPMVFELYYIFCIRSANKEIQQYIHMSKECIIEAYSIRDKLNS